MIFSTPKARSLKQILCGLVSLPILKKLFVEFTFVKSLGFASSPE